MRRLTRFLVALAQFLASKFGAREAMLIVGLALVGYGARLVYAPAGFFLPGAVMLALVAFGIRA